MELIDLIPNSKSFRIITTLDIDDESEIPAAFTGRVRRSADKAFVYVAWYEDGRLHDPGRHHPAYRRFRGSGAIKYDMHYSHGRLHDPSDGHAAVRGFYANGAIHYEEHYKHGLRNDGATGAAAITKWREDGSVRHQLHYLNGQRLR